MPASSRRPATPHPKRRAADLAYDRIESLLCKLELPPGSAIIEAELAERAQLGRTPVREALMRMVSMGLVQQQPRRGLTVTPIDVLDHLDVLETRRALERLIAASAARRATAPQRKAIEACGRDMVKAASRGDLDHYMAMDQALDHEVHDACRNQSAVNAVLPLVIKCRRFWYAYQHAGDMGEAAAAHLRMAQAIAQSDAAAAAVEASGLMDYLARFARRVIDG